MAAFWSRRHLLALWIFVLAVAVSASVAEKVLQIPLFEVGQLWFNALATVYGRIFSLFTTVPDFSLWTTYVFLLVVVCMIYCWYVFCVKPMNRVQKLGEMGYIAEDSFTVKETANFVQKRRKVGNIPPVYPNGWFGILESSHLKNGEAKSVSALGLNLAVFRDEKGTTHVLDAYCPHMGAHLAAGGRVFGDCLECPFHAWRFRGHDGKCTHIPYADKIPEIAKVKSWTVCELNGWIYLWHHAEGKEPDWKLPEMEDITNGNWAYCGRTEHYVNAHIEEIPENGADVYHLYQVHSPIVSAGVDLRLMWSQVWSFAHHSWTAQWESLPAPDAHIGSISLTHQIKLFGFRLPALDVEVHGKQIGPAVVYLEINSVFGRGVYIHNLLPIAPMVQKMVHNIYFNWKAPTFIGKLFMLAEALQVERDMMIWNNKQYEARPLFVKSKEDSLISRHRRWYSQFYSENSPRLTFSKDTLDW